MALPLLRPQLDDAALRRYTYRVVPTWSLFGCLLMGPFYGFNVWIIDVLRVFGSRHLWSPFGATVATAFTLATLSCGVSSALVGRWVPRIGARRIYFVGTLFSCCAMVLSGVAIECESLVGLYLSWGVLYGLSQGCTFIALVTCCMGWFRKHGAAGHGAGWIGFCLGFWPAVFSYAGPAAVYAVGLARSFQLCAVVLVVIAVWPALFICMPDEVTCTAPQVASAKDLQQHADAENASRDGNGCSDDSTTASTPTSRADAAPAGSPMAEPMTMRQVFVRPDFWVRWFQFLLALMPGFGIIYIVSPMMMSIFNASNGLQTTASFVFLVGYAAARLVSGLVVGPCISASRFAGGCIAMQTFACAITGAFLLSVPGGGRGGERGNDVSACVFVVLIACIGMSLASLKVMIPLLALDIGGPANIGLITGLMYAGGGLAAVLGPVTSWMALASDAGRDSPFAVAAWFGGGAGLTAVAMLLHLAKPRLARAA